MSTAELFDAVDVIRTKRDKARLSDAQIDWVVDAYTRGAVADEQMSALAMAIPASPAATAALPTCWQFAASSNRALDSSGARSSRIGSLPLSSCALAGTASAGCDPSRCASANRADSRSRLAASAESGLPRIRLGWFFRCWAIASARPPSVITCRRACHPAAPVARRSPSVASIAAAKSGRPSCRGGSVSQVVVGPGFRSGIGTGSQRSMGSLKTSHKAATVTTVRPCELHQVMVGLIGVGSAAH